MKTEQKDGQWQKILNEKRQLTGFKTEEHQQERKSR